MIFSKSLEKIGLGLAACVVAASLSQAAEAQPPRIVSIGGDVTEIIYALDRQTDLVATDATSVYPPAALSTPKIGYMRQLSAEGVLSVEPDLILISGAAGPEAAVAQIRNSGARVLEIPLDYSVDGIFEKTRLVAQEVNAVAQGDALLGEMKSDWKDALSEIDAIGFSPRILFFATLQDGTPQAAGTGTAAHAVIEILGGQNVFASQRSYKPLSLEAAVASDPDLILVMDRHGSEVIGVDAAKGHPGLKLTQAVQEGRVFAVNAVEVMQFGPRTPKALGALAKEIRLGLNKSDDG